MGPSSRQHQTSLFQVYLRLRPPISSHPDGQPPQAERYLIPESPEPSQIVEGTTNAPTHITLQPPTESRKRAVERFGFTKVFEENASQLDVFQDTGMESLLKGVLQEVRDGLVATLGVTGSGKSHTILGSKSERGVAQLALDILFRSLAPSVREPDNSITPLQLASLAASDPTEAQLFSAQAFLEAVYGEPNGERGRHSRAQTPMSSSRAQTPLTVWNPPPQKPWKGTAIIHPSSLRQCHFKASEEPETMEPREIETFLAPGCAHRLGSRNNPKEGLAHMSPLPAPSSHSTHDVESGFAKTSRQSIKEPTPALIFPRRHVAQRPSALPRVPDVGHFTFDVKPNSEYMVLVSMYEVYNDRIFDLLSPSIVPGQLSTMSRQGNAQKDRRRPLLFKPTESSPDRKVVAGLRKIACATYEEALGVLDIGLTERKVAGTGSNTVSSRSHGFFCLEVKRKKKGKAPGEDTWVGNTLTIVDLAGSERARAAKTTGATLAEAGKINESLMYLGQCLQMQSGLQEGSKNTLVPFRQCKLTELLFSNSFLSPAQVTHNRRPQKALMIVTADPLGDFNATSQILRYSALAREVTVPRIPSVSDTILSSSSSSRSQGSGRTSPNFVSNEELDRAMTEIKRLSSDCHTLSVKLAEEEIVREELEIRLGSAEERCLMTEQEVREECWAEMDEKMVEERRRWQDAWDEQNGRNDEHLDKKIEVLSRGFQIYEDPEPSTDERAGQLELENDQLRSKIAALERELMGRSPTKKSKSRNALGPSRTSNILGRESDIEMALSRMDQLKLTDSMFSPQTSTAGKKQKVMTTRKWDLAPEDDI